MRPLGLVSPPTPPWGAGKVGLGPGLAGSSRPASLTEGHQEAPHACSASPWGPNPAPPPAPPRPPPPQPGIPPVCRSGSGASSGSGCGGSADQPQLYGGPRSRAPFLSLEPPLGGGRLIQRSLSDPAPSEPAGIRGPGFGHSPAPPAKTSVILRAQDPESCAVVPLPPAPIPL